MDRPPFMELLTAHKQLIGMIHLQALPGTPHNTLDVETIASRAVAEAAICRDAGISTLIIENMHDVPYVKRVGPEITAAMTRIAGEVRRLGVTLGIQLLAGANREALAVALATDADFVRVEGFVYAHVADEGFTDACAGELLRYRRCIGADHIAILADIKKKHCAHAITADVDLKETARTAEMFGADALIVSGRHTGEPTDPGDVNAAREAVLCPVLVGSGVTPNNLETTLPWCSGVIVGSWVKQDGNWSRPIDPARLKEMVQAFQALT